MSEAALRGRGFVVAAKRVARALVALPLQIVAVARAVADRSDETETPPRPTNEPGRAARIRRSLLGLPIAFVANVAAIVSVLSLARAIYYPFWAAGASHDALARSWGGPSAVGATLVHWLVAAAVIVAGYGVIIVAERLRGERPKDRSA